MSFLTQIFAAVLIVTISSLLWKVAAHRRRFQGLVSLVSLELMAANYHLSPCSQNRLIAFSLDIFQFSSLSLGSCPLQSLLLSLSHAFKKCTSSQMSFTLTCGRSPAPSSSQVMQQLPISFSTTTRGTQWCLRRRCSPSLAVPVDLCHPMYRNGTTRGRRFGLSSLSPTYSVSSPQWRSIRCSFATRCCSEQRPARASP